MVYLHWKLDVVYVYIYMWQTIICVAVCNFHLAYHYYIFIHGNRVSIVLPAFAFFITRHTASMETHPIIMTNLHMFTFSRTRAPLVRFRLRSIVYRFYEVNFYARWLVHHESKTENIRQMDAITTDEIKFLFVSHCFVLLDYSHCGIVYAFSGAFGGNMRSILKNS